MDSLIDLDHQLFILMNGQWTNPLFDRFFPAITDLNESPITWVVACLLVAFWIYKRREKALKWLVLLGAALAATDMFAYRVLKPLVERNRPGFSGVAYVLRTNVHHGNSFPSNHAANMFALAMVVGSAEPAARWPLYLLAFLVAYSRVYVGVHFPLDVIGGAITGLIIGWIFVRWLGDWASVSKTDFKRDGGSSRARS